MLKTCIKLPFVIKIFVLSIFEWLLKTGFFFLGGGGGIRERSGSMVECLIRD